MNGLGDYSSGEQIDSLLKQMEDMEQELADKNRELESLWNRMQEKDRRIQNLSSGSQKLKSQIQSMKSVLSEQGETLRHQTEQLEKYSGSDILFQENKNLKEEMEKAEKRGRELEEKAAAVLAQADRRKMLSGNLPKQTDCWQNIRNACRGSGEGEKGITEESTGGI